jgi:hypothetical protein
MAAADANISNNEFQPTRVLGSGKAAMTSSMQGFGCMGITAFYGKPIPDEDAIAVITHACECS